MYKHKLFARHPRHLLKSKGSFKIHTKSHHKTGKGMILDHYNMLYNPMDNYLLSLVNGVRHNMKISDKKHHGAGTSHNKYHTHHKSGGALKFIR